jgi:hypothetical protein
MRGEEDLSKGTAYDPWIGQHQSTLRRRAVREGAILILNAHS